MMRNIFFIVILLGFTAVIAQDSTNENSDTDKQAEKNKEKTQQTEEELRPEVFNPTEQLSEDKDVSFPTDI